MNPENETNPKQMHFALLLIISILLFPLGFTVYQTLTWTDRWEAFRSGIFQGALLAIPWSIIYIIPWSLIIFGLYRWRRWHRFRTQWILAPSVVATWVLIGSTILESQSPIKRFERFTKTSLPSDAKDLHCVLSGGGSIDFFDTYYFSTSPTEVDRLIREMNLEEDDLYTRGALSHSGIRPLEGCPDYTSWQGSTLYKGWDKEQQWFYYVITDSTRSRVYVVVGCI
jgi:hypothetical protein